MTACERISGWSPIGALELKRAYQKNMALGEGFVGLLVLSIWLLSVIVPHRQEGFVTDPTPHLRDHYVNLGPPPSVVPRPPQVQVQLDPGKLPILSIEAGPEGEVIEDLSLHSQEELAALTPPSTSDLGVIGGHGYDPSVLEQDTAPVFVPFDELPVAVMLPIPEYPQMARRAGIEGDVAVEVRVEIDGSVGEARAILSTVHNAGFEDAAVKTSLKGQWRPALQNKQAVAVRVTYVIKFRLN